MSRAPKSPLEQAIREYDQDVLHMLELVASSFLSTFKEEMERMSISRSDLALTLDLNRSQISRMLNKPGNLTLRTLVALAMALDHKIDLGLVPFNPLPIPLSPNVTRWVDWGKEEPSEVCNSSSEIEETDWPLVANGR